MTLAKCIEYRPEAPCFSAAQEVAKLASLWVCVLPHRIETVAAVLGVASVALVLPLSSDATSDEVAEHKNRLSAHGLLIDRSRLEQIDTTAFETIVVFEADGTFSNLTSPQAAIPILQTGLILMTSGSTGKPKYVPLSEDKLLGSAENIARTLDLSARDTAALALPMFHIGAFVDLYLAPLLRAGDVRVLPPKDIAEMIAATQSGAVTWIQMVPTQLAAFLRNLNTDACAAINRNIRFIRLVSADLSPDLQQLAEKTLPDVAIIQMYGMTETAGQITSNGLQADDRRSGSVGRGAGAQIAIRSPLGQGVALGEVGEVWARSPNFMGGYLLDAPITLDSDGWFQTGDLGRLGDDGFLYLVGRDRDIINRGGEKVSFQDVERAALAIDAVQEAACFAIPHVSLGQDLGLTVVSNDETLTVSDLRSKLAEALATHKLPRQFHLTGRLAVLRGGKVDRAGLLENWRQEQANVPDVALTKDEEKLAEIWTQVLGLPITQGSADFFDFGGDSLSAEIALTMTEEQFGVRLEPGVLYQSPTLSEMADMLATAPSRKTSGYLPARTVRSLRSATSTWSGRRLDPLGLIMVRNEDAPGTPVFWVCNSDVESTGLSYALADRHPVYVMRTLFRHKNKIGQKYEISKLEKYYADHIAIIAQGRDLILGGFCDGAKMAFNMLDPLQQSDVPVKIFLSADQEHSNPISVPAIFLRSAESVTLDAFSFRRQDAGLRYIAAGGHELVSIDESHVGMLSYPYVTPFADAISRADKEGIAGGEGAQIYDRRRAWQVYRLSITSPRWVQRSRAFDVSVTLTNRSSQDWSVTDCRDLYFWARFKNFDGYVRVREAAFADVSAPLLRGQSVTIPMTLTYPNTGLPQILQIGLVDDGLGWLPKRASRLIFAH